MDIIDPTSTTRSQDEPSLFEHLAQDQLRALLQPAVRYVTNVLAHSYPRYLIPVVNRHEEFYALLMFWVERHHLLKHSASFSEHFYGLRRRRAVPIPTTRWDAFDADHGGLRGRMKLELSSKQIWASMAELVLVPYVQLKLHQYFLSLGGGVDTSILPPTLPTPADESDAPPSRRDRLKARFKALYLILYPWISLGSQLGRLFWRLAYLFGKGRFWSLESWLVGYTIGRISREDLENPIPKRPTLFTTLIPRSSILNRLPSPPKILPFLLLSLKFLEFYHSPTSPFQLLSSTGSSLDGSSKSTTQPILPPPPQPTPSEKGLALLKDKAWGECPLCGLPWRAPTVGGRTGGWVYCWECLSDEVGEKGSVDPVTGTGWVTQESFRRVLI